MLCSLLTTVIRRTPWGSQFDSWRNHRKLARWRRQGYPVPAPPSYKYGVLRNFGLLHSIRTLVETGTCHGDAIQANLTAFDKIYSIELSTELHRLAVARFAHCDHVELLQGDSGEVLPSVLARLRAPAVFWLDGHYSGGPTAQGTLDTPIVRELEAVLAHPVPGHVILIDDARLFVGQHDYPTIDATRQIVRRVRPQATFAVEHDIIRICLPASA